MYASTEKLERSSLKATRRTPAPTLVALVLATIAATNPARAGNQWILSVGINKYTSGLNPLGSCVNDCYDMLDALAADASRWDPQRMYYLTDYDATKDNIRSGIYYLAGLAQPGDTVVYFQASHGGQVTTGSKATFLCSTDGEYHDTEVGADLAAWFSDDVTVCFVIDACHSGGLIKGADSASRESRSWSFAENAMSAFMQAKGVPVEAGARATGVNVSFMTAADYNEFSSELGRNGFYTGSLVHAMKNAAADASGDGLLSFLEMHQWAAIRASSLNPDQNAQLSNQSLISRTIVAQRGTGTETLDDIPDPPCSGGVGCMPEPCASGLCCDMRGGTPALMALGFAGFMSNQRRRHMKR